MDLGLHLRLGTGLSSFSPISLFSAGEQGAWYDPSDFSTMFQDSAGATPVTAAGQQVGLLLDKSGRGNHATQATSAQRPTLGRNPVTGTRNLLTYTEQFDNAAWVKANATVTANAAVAPDGTTTADKAVATNTAATTRAVYQNFTAPATASYAASFYVKAAEYSRFAIQEIAGGRFGASFDLSAQTTASLGGAGFVSSSITNVGDGWFRCVVVWSGVASTGYAVTAIGYPAGATVTNAGASYAGDGTSGILIWGAQLETGSTATAYQRVVSAFDVTQAGVADAWYLSCDGTDDGMVTNTITPGIDKAQVFAGVRKLSDAARSTLVELSASTVTNNGAMHMTAPEAASATFAYMSKGTAQSTAVATSLAAPTTRVLTGLADISGDSVILRVNGTQAAADTTTDQGTGNFLPYPLYIGRRGGSSLPFNGRIYGLAVRFGANLTAAQITQMETWMNGKTGAY